MVSLSDTLRDFHPPAPTYLPKDYPDLTGKVVAITGTTVNGIGYEVLKAVLLKNAKAIIFNRNASKVEDTIKALEKELSIDLKESIISVLVDLSDLTTTKPAFAQFEKAHPEISYINLAIFNAGVMQPPNGSKTKQGYELQIGTNVLGHQLLIHFLQPYLLKSAQLQFDTRVVWVTSVGHNYSPPNGIDWNLVHDAPSSKLRVYGQSKACNIYQANIYGQKYAKDGIISVAAHPGLLDTELARYYPKFLLCLMKYLLYPPVYGSYTELYAALSPDITVKNNGQYIVPWGEFYHKRQDIEDGCHNGVGEKVWDWAEEQIKPYK